MPCFGRGKYLKAQSLTTCFIANTTNTITKVSSTSFVSPEEWKLSSFHAYLGWPPYTLSSISLDNHCLPNFSYDFQGVILALPTAFSLWFLHYCSWCHHLQAPISAPQSHFLTHFLPPPIGFQPLPVIPLQWCFHLHHLLFRDHCSPSHNHHWPGLLDSPELLSRFLPWDAQVRTAGTQQSFLWNAQMHCCLNKTQIPYARWRSPTLPAFIPFSELSCAPLPFSGWLFVPQAFQVPPLWAHLLRVFFLSVLAWFIIRNSD